MTDTSQKLKVFLCHVSENKPTVQGLYDRLKADGFDPWLDSEFLLPGMDWDLEIRKAMRASDAVLVCLSSLSVKKEGYVQKEIRFALDIQQEKPEGTIFLIPIHLEACDIPYSLQDVQWAHYFEPNGYEKIVKALKIRAKQLDQEIKETDDINTLTDSIETNEKENDEKKHINHLPSKKNFPVSVRKFSTILNKATKGKNISGLGLSFISKVKSSPPFLGFARSAISQDLEREFTEHFIAKEFIEKDKDIKGGDFYRSYDGKTQEEVAINVYGDAKYVYLVSPSVFITGSYQPPLPFFDTNENRRLSTKEIEKIHSKASMKNLQPAIDEMVRKYNLPETEVVFLMEIIYEAAKKARK